MIQGFKCEETERIFGGRFSRKLPQDIQKVAKRKLNMLHAAISVDDLRVPPNNRLEKWKGNRKDQYSIRINDQWRVCFVFEAGTASQVQIVDYH